MDRRGHCTNTHYPGKEVLDLDLNTPVTRVANPNTSQQHATSTSSSSGWIERRATTFS
jgi:hypothetical protein